MILLAICFIALLLCPDVVCSLASGQARGEETESESQTWQRDYNVGDWRSDHYYHITLATGPIRRLISNNIWHICQHHHQYDFKSKWTDVCICHSNPIWKQYHTPWPTVIEFYRRLNKRKLPVFVSCELCCDRHMVKSWVRDAPIHHWPTITLVNVALMVTQI